MEEGKHTLAVYGDRSLSICRLALEVSDSLTKRVLAHQLHGNCRWLQAYQVGLDRYSQRQWIMQKYAVRLPSTGRQEWSNGVGNKADDG